MDWTLDQAYSFSEGAVRFAITGKGPPVVLVHGTPWSSFTWHKQVTALADRYTVHVYDLVGYGQSEKRDGQDVSLAVQGRLLAELLDHWSLARPRIVAHDFGGAISLRAHLLSGREYDRLALMNVVALAPWGSPFFAHVRANEAAFAGVPGYIHRAIVEAYIKGALFTDLEPAEFDALVAPWLGEAGQGAFYRQIAQADQRYTDEIEPHYGDIRCPVLVMWGKEDSWIPLETGQRLHRAIPGSRFIEVEKAGHLVQLDAPDRITAALLDFLGEPA